MRRTLLFLLIALFLTACDRPETPPQYRPWTEQLQAIQQVLQPDDGEYLLIGGQASLADKGQNDPVEPRDLVITLVFTRPQPNADGSYPARLVHYNDYHLDDTLVLDAPSYIQPDSETEPGDWVGVPAAELGVGPHDVLQMTLEEGRRHLGTDPNSGSLTLRLLPAAEVAAEAPAPPGTGLVWKVTYYSPTGNLSFYIDARTGQLLIQRQE
jgi:hypothetical protein